MKNSLKTNLISKLKLINVFLIVFGFNLIDIESKAHLRGKYLTESSFGFSRKSYDRTLSSS